nr:reco: DNA repair protein [uncultured bacterium]
MTDEKTTGIILRVRPLTETSLIIHWLSPDAGRIATVAKGARRAKSPIRGKLDLFYTAEFTYQRSRRSELHTLREVELKQTYPALRTSIEYVTLAAYCAALIEQVTETDTPLPEFYELMEHLLQHFSTHPQGPFTLFVFEMKLLWAHGLQPDLDEAKLTEGSRRILEQAALLDWPALSQLKLSQSQEKEVQHFLHNQLLVNFGKIPKSRLSALNVMATATS